ncbi:hypothetical protein SJDPG12_04725 [Porphyromonas gingivalis SJD12]|nr:hypothetical protein SJDPG12_04725 [Porphyromonas gingivalis SJD12]
MTFRLLSQSDIKSQKEKDPQTHKIKTILLVIMKNIFPLQQNIINNWL